jgi:streptomycin 6-kinase
MDNDETGPIPADLVKKAKAVFEELYTKNAERFLLHGDFHHGNILSDGDGFRVIDPEGAIGPIGYEIAVFLNEHSRWMRGKEKAEQEAVFAVEAFAEAFSAEPNDLCEWAFCQMMLAQCWDVEDFGEADPSDVEMAARWLEIKEMIGGKGADET